jgi:hypothetical protein
MSSGESCQNNYDRPNPQLSPESRIRLLEGNQMKEVSQTIFEMQLRIASKLQRIFFSTDARKQILKLRTMKNSR